MPPLLDRDTKITYGSTVIGGLAGGTSFSPVGRFVLDQDIERAIFEVDVLVENQTEADFIGDCNNLQNEFNIPRQRLLVELGSTERYDFDPSDNSGLNARPSWRKLDDPKTQGRSALYRVRVEVELPADWGSQAGRRASQVRVTKLDSKRRLVEISGTYTAVSSNDATAQYEAQISTYASSVLTGVDASATFELIGPEVTDRDDSDKLVNFVRTYAELIANDTASTLDDPDLIGQQMDVSVAELGGDQGRDAGVQPNRIVITYSTAVDKESTTDLRSKFASTIRPHLTNQARVNSGGGTLAILEITPSYDFPNNRIGARLIAEAHTAAISESTMEVEDDRDLGLVHEPRTDGVEHSYDEFQGPKRHVRIVRTTTVRRGEGGVVSVAAQVGTQIDPGSPSGLAAASSGGGDDVPDPDSGFRVIRHNLRRRTIWRGIRGQGRLRLEAEIETTVMLRIGTG